MARAVISKVWLGKQPWGLHGPVLSASPGQWQEATLVTVSMPGAWLTAMLINAVYVVGSVTCSTQLREGAVCDIELRASLINEDTRCLNRAQMP